MVPVGAASFFLHATMSRILFPLLIALSMAASGCAVVLPQDREAVDGWSCSIIAPDARTVTVAGSFNRWDPGNHPLAGPDRSGRWAATLRLPPGRYEYLFVIDGSTWLPDPEVPSVDNGLGGRNSIVIVTEGGDGEK
jgi:1,4-alpha-glucan branching enzyme